MEQLVEDHPELVYVADAVIEARIIPVGEIDGVLVIIYVRWNIFLSVPGARAKAQGS